MDAWMDRLIKKRVKEGNEGGVFTSSVICGTTGVGVGGGGLDASWHCAQICN